MIESKVAEKLYGITAKQIYEWIINLDQEKYKQWHPDHTNYQKKESENGEYLGTLIKYEQRVDETSFWWEVTNCTENKIVYKAKFIYPIYLELTFEDLPDHSLMTQRLKMGIKFPVVENVLDWLVSKIIFTPETEKQFTVHTQQEFKNLEHLLH